MRLSDRLPEKGVLVDSPAASKREVLQEMSDLLCTVNGIDDRAGLLAAVLEREAAMSTGIGCGLAVPHAKAPFVKELCIAACSVKGGLDFAAIDGQPVYLLFLIVSPTGAPGPHIRALSAVSRLLSAADVRKSLVEAKSPSEFYANLKAGEAKYA